jgi:hypothetical protein
MEAARGGMQDAEAPGSPVLASPIGYNGAGSIQRLSSERRNRELAGTSSTFAAQA